MWITLHSVAPTNPGNCELVTPRSMWLKWSVWMIFVSWNLNFLTLGTYLWRWSRMSAISSSLFSFFRNTPSGTCMNKNNAMNEWMTNYFLNPQLLTFLPFVYNKHVGYDYPQLSYHQCQVYSVLIYEWSEPDVGWNSCSTRQERVHIQHFRVNEPCAGFQMPEVNLIFDCINMKIVQLFGLMVKPHIPRLDTLVYVIPNQPEPHHWDVSPSELSLHCDCN